MRRSYLLFVLLVLLLAGCSAERAQTIDPPPIATQEPTLVSPTALPPTNEPTAPVEPTAIPVEPSSTPVEPTPTQVEPSATPLPTETPTPTATEVSAAVEDDLDAIVESLISLSDMPTGWTGEAPTFEERTPGGTYTAYCVDGLPSRSIARASVNFERSAFGPLVSQTIVLYPDRASASDAFADLVDAASGCPEFVDQSGNRFTLNPLSFPNLGDETFALRSGGTLEIDSIKILIDNVIIDITNGGLGAVDSALTEEIARLAVDKFR